MKGKRRMNLMTKWMVMAGMMLAVAMPAVLGAESTNSVSPAGTLLRNAYLAVVEAELARAERRDTDAVAAYRKALGLYGRLQAEYPGWQAAMVSYRVAECQNDLSSLEAGNGSTSNAVVAAHSETNAPRRLEALLVELRDARAALGAEKDNTVELREKQLGQEVDRLSEELQQAAKANQALIRRTAKLEAKLNRSGLAEGTNTLCKAVAAAVKAEARRMTQEGKMETAVALLREAAELMPSEHDLVVQLAVAHCRDGKFGDAVQVLQPFDVKHPSNADALLTLGTAYMGLGKIGEARVVTEKALKLNPESAETHYNMAQILITITPPDLAASQQHYRRALELGLAADPDFENTLRTAQIIGRLKTQRKTSLRRLWGEQEAPKVQPIPAVR